MGRTALIVDDHADFRTQAAGLLESSGYEVVCTCADGLSALDAIASLLPDLVLLDVQLPDIDGFGVMAQLVERGTTPTVVLISSREESDYGGRVRRSGAAGFISKADLSTQALDEITAGR